MTIAAGPESIEVRVAAIQPARSQQAGDPLFAVVLEEIGGSRRMPVVMRKPEADAIAIHLQNMPTTRPLTYAFMAGLLHALGGRLLEARITRSDGQTIYASAVVSGCHGTQVVDARPSDVINLALRVGAPIRLDPGVLEARGVPGPQAEAPGIDWA
jgi:bifunctional DNase/RNase